MKTKYSIVSLIGVCAALSVHGARAIATPEPRINTPSGFYTTNQITVEGTAEANSGITSIQYLLNGHGPFTAMQPNTNNWNKWQAPVTLTAGSNVFQVWAVSTNGLSPTNSARFFLIVDSPITVSVVGSGSVVPNYNGRNLIIDRSYTMVAVRRSGQVFAGWSGTVASVHPVLNFLMQAGENLTATFEPSPFTNGLTGIYNGLFYDGNNLAEASSGFLTLTLGGDDGVFSGDIMLDGLVYYFASQFDATGAAQFTVPRPVRGNLSVSLSLDLTGVHGLTGSVICTGGNAFGASLQAYLEVNKHSEYAGYYTWAMNGALVGGAAGPNGYSYGTITVPRLGAAAVYVNLSDGLSTIVSGGLTQAGLLPLYISLNGGHGSVSGWLLFNTNDLTVNSMAWFKKPGPPGYYTNGYALTSLPLVMSPYVKGVNSLGSSNVVVQLAAGDLIGTLTDFVTLGAGTKFSATDTNDIAVALDLKTGLFSGAFIDPADGKSAALHGVPVQPAREAFGFFMANNHLSGTVNITGATAP